jgi:hypothetical protein
MIPVFRQDEPEGPEEAGGANPEWLRELLEARNRTEPDEDHHLYCFVCGAAITRIELRIFIGNSHRHTFTNPGGFVYEIGCFSEAEGCEEEGEPTEEFSWFAGYTWHFAFCSGCGTHLGWVYQSATETPGHFFGLILNRLVAGRDNFPSTS